MENGEAEGERGKPTCDRRQLPKNKNSTTHSARKAHHPALRLPAVSVDIPLGDAGWGEGRITCQKSPNPPTKSSSPGHPQLSLRPAACQLFCCFTLGRKHSFHLFYAMLS